jgi:hypothetical protein
MDMSLYQKREWFSVSALVAASRCLRKFFYGSGCRLRPAGGEHSALKFGSAIHKALPELLHGEIKTALDRAMAAFDSVWNEAEDPSIADKKRNRERARAMLFDFALAHQGRNSLYELQRPPSGNIVKLEDKVSDWEVPFAIAIPGLDVPLVGRIDALVRHRDTKKLWGLEWKTSSELSGRFLESFKNSPQVIAYTLALRTLTDEHVEGIMVEGLRVSPSNAENLLQPVSVPDFKVDWFIKWARFWGNLVLECEKRGEFPYNLSGCNPYSMFGMPGYECEFMKLCSVSDWETLKDFYVVSTERPFILAPNQPVLQGASDILPPERSLPVVQPTDSTGNLGTDLDVLQEPRLVPVHSQSVDPKDPSLPSNAEFSGTGGVS